jgi:hydrogenase maturation protease
MSAPRILIAGVGNIFHGDDGFGVEVVRRLQDTYLPDGVRAVDFGIRAFDLACAILDGYDAVVLVDATCRGGKPGTLYVVELKPDPVSDEPGPIPTNPHGLNPTSTLRWVQAMGGRLPPMVLVGCEPAVLGSQEDVLMALSEAVQACVARALATIHSLVRELRGELVEHASTSFSA